MKFELPSLPYTMDALEPVISKTTLEFHHGKHHQAYINKVNELIEGTPFADSSLEEMIKSADGVLFNNAAQAWNHTFYFEAFSPKGGGQPKGKLADLIDKKWGSFENFKQEFTNAGIALFGSGWVWLAIKNDSPEILKESNAGNPIKQGYTPLLTFDVWEHAYYLDVQNRRPDHLKALWNIIDWSVIEKRLQ